MRLPSKERLLSSAVIAGLAAVLVVLAVLQYRWSKEISEATSVRMQMGLHASMIGLRQGLEGELTKICFALQPDVGPGSLHDKMRSIQRFQHWSRTTQHAGLVKDVLVWQDSIGNHPQLSRLNIATSQLEPESWPADLDALRSHLQTMAEDFRSTFNNRNLPDMLRDPAPNMHGGHGHVNHENHSTGSGELRPSPEFRPSDRRFPGHGNPFSPWQVDENIPALVRPMFHRSNAQNARGGTAMLAVDWIVVWLDGKFLREHVMPEMVNQYFNGPDGLAYEVALIGGSEPGHVIYSSDPQFGEQDTSAVDVAVPVFGSSRDHHPPMEMFAHDPGAIHNDIPSHLMRHAGAPGFLGPPGFEVIRYSSGQKDWQLIARNRKGPLEAVVAEVRHRNLALSFGVLLLLAASMGMIIVASQRAQKLARLQMDFVAAISHELRTPLAVICSAADNIVDGLVEGKEQLTKYGHAIKNQGQQLNQLVEQILLFAATRQNGDLYNFRPLQASEIVAAALLNTSGLIQSEQIIVEQHIEPNLPEVMGDLSAFSQCLQNLITNAVKYGGEQRWIGIRAILSEGGRGKEIQISIEDRGLGIAPAELAHIFEPFYRSPAVTAAQIHGTGLGLPLAQSMAQAMGAKLTVISVPGQGSVFTLHVPVAHAGALKTGVAMNTATNPKFS
jgi:two-component system sensor histidine kinase SenX3